MVFVKVIKNVAYFKRYQVKYRRRREGKTDYYARRKMVRQDKNKYNSKKYRLIVRFTNTKCIVQVAYATLLGDIVVAAANSTELKQYGIPAGYKNYAAAYCTGLLCARRVLKKYGLDQQFKGKKEIDGEEYHVEDTDEAEGRKPFKAILDVGLTATTTGARIWGALKGAVDGGLHVPHNCKRFPGFEAADEKGGESKYEAEAHKEKIMGGHLKDYMESMEEEDPTKYEAHFPRYISAGIDAEKIEDMYSSAHQKIRANPDAPKPKPAKTWTRKGNTVKCSDGTEAQRSTKLTLRQRRNKVQVKIEAAQAKAAAAADDE